MIAIKDFGLSFDYVAVNMAKGERLTPEYLQLNPLGYVPVLVDGDTVVFESFAILMNFVEDKVCPDEKLAWAQCHTGKGFAGKIY
ncbi:hypothetical protein GH714_031125 [Hevea brasiliensis]|uniref:GST N-terminal domain-containing protein n=1 Tax=Hevea brasiliensis TaxID=3981 RepID=A0A6A6NKA6_HEVBR|nr:hypothetical protein GH714_031125 [Hevea brasiliensis]